MAYLACMLDTSLVVRLDTRTSLFDHIGRVNPSSLSFWLQKSFDNSFYWGFLSLPSSQR